MHTNICILNMDYEHAGRSIKPVEWFSNVDLQKGPWAFRQALNISLTPNSSQDCTPTFISCELSLAHPFVLIYPLQFVPCFICPIWDINFFVASFCCIIHFGSLVSLFPVISVKTVMHPSCSFSSYILQCCQVSVF